MPSVNAFVNHKVCPKPVFFWFFAVACNIQKAGLCCVTKCLYVSVHHRGSRCVFDACAVTCFQAACLLLRTWKETCSHSIVWINRGMHLNHGMHRTACSMHLPSYMSCMWINHGVHACTFMPSCHVNTRMHADGPWSCPGCSIGCG